MWLTTVATERLNLQPTLTTKVDGVRRGLGLNCVLLFQSLDSGNRVITQPFSFLTAAAGTRSVTAASAPTGTSAAQRWVLSSQIRRNFLASFLKVPRFQVRCGRRPCRLQAPPSPADATALSCPGGHECIQHPFLTCFTPPCGAHQWGVCSTPDPPTPLNTQCEPNSGYLDNSCARITLIFKKDKVPKVRKNQDTFSSLANALA